MSFVVSLFYHKGHKGNTKFTKKNIHFFPVYGVFPIDKFDEGIRQCLDERVGLVLSGVFGVGASCAYPIVHYLVMMRKK